MTCLDIIEQQFQKKKKKKEERGDDLYLRYRKTNDRFEQVELD